MKKLSLFLLLAIAWPLHAQEVPLSVQGVGVKTVTIVEALPITISAPPGAAIYVWTFPPGVTAFEAEEKLEVIGAPKGAMTVRVKAIFVDFKLQKITTKFGKIEVVVGTKPGPDPPPPDPDPKPEPKTGSRVLIVYESAELAKMPAAQQAILFSASVRAFLNAKCAVGPDGKTKEWRIYDKDTDVSKESKFWQDAMKGVPVGHWRILDKSGATAFQGSLPANVDEALALLKKHLGE